jgi:hypothetical protein
MQFRCPKAKTLARYADFNNSYRPPVFVKSRFGCPNTYIITYKYL